MRLAAPSTFSSPSPVRERGPGGEVERGRGNRGRGAKLASEVKRARGGVAKRAKVVDTPSSRRAARLGLGTRPAAGQLLAGRAEPAWIRAAGDAERLPGTLKMPVARGWFVRGFGSGEGGYHQAMDIGGEVGWNVRAAAPGLVGYAGNEVNGYGNLVIVIHPGGWITIYAHNEKNRVSAGQRVDRGTVLASLGSTGRSKGPHVHFELLFDGENCDPGPLLRPGVPRRIGKMVAYEKLTWRHPDKRPRGIACHARRHHPAYVGKPEPEDLDGAPDEDAGPTTDAAP